MQYVEKGSSELRGKREKVLEEFECDCYCFLLLQNLLLFAVFGFDDFVFVCRLFLSSSVTCQYFAHSIARW